MIVLTSSAKTIVLVVEDDSLIRMLAVVTVEEAGFDVLEAENADDAIRILESRGDVRVVFTDIDMPGSMDGLMFAIAVRGRWPPIEIILTSGHRAVAKKDMPERSVFIAKPYESRRVIDVLRDMAA